MHGHFPLRKAELDIRVRHHGLFPFLHINKCKCIFYYSSWQGTLCVPYCAILTIYGVLWVKLNDFIKTSAIGSTDHTESSQSRGADVA